MSKKKFIVAKTTKVTPSKFNVEKLDKVLVQKSREINSILFGLDSIRRVGMTAFGSHFSDDVVISIGFRKKDKTKHPNKYGDEFRSRMRAFAWERANEILTDDCKEFRMYLREDNELVETIDYERK